MEDKFVGATLVAIVVGMIMSLGLVAVIIWAVYRAVEKYL